MPKWAAGNERGLDAVAQTSCPKWHILRETALDTA